MKASDTDFADQTETGSRLAALARWILAGIFISMGFTKAMHPADFLKLVRQYDLLHDYHTLNFVAVTLPWLEIFCGSLLLLGVAVRGTIVVILTMLGAFTAAVLFRALALHGATGIPFCAIRFDCGCGSGEIAICRKLGENCALLILAAAILCARSRRFCLQHTLLPTAKNR